MTETNEPTLPLSVEKGRALLDALGSKVQNHGQPFRGGVAIESADSDLLT